MNSDVALKGAEIVEIFATLTINFADVKLQLKLTNCNMRFNCNLTTVN